MAAVRRNKTGLGGHKAGSFPSAMKPHHNVKGGHHHHTKMKRSSAPGQIR